MRHRRMKSTRVSNIRRKIREARRALITYSLRDVIKMVLSRRMKWERNVTYFGRMNR
jgi:hypothetical protein